MKVLVIGGGGREHALCWKLAQDASVDAIYVAPGNAGTAGIARNVDVSTDDHDAVSSLCAQEGMGLVVVGPEAPLCRGLADRLRADGFPVFGPGAGGAELEGSKAFSKALMSHHGIPTAGFRTFDDAGFAREYLEGDLPFPVVVKASGLAAGKGVLICPDREAALAAVDQLMERRQFGLSGDTVVIEDFLEGEEVSVHAITDGRTILTLPTSEDHKRVFDHDEGPNTGGMGAVSPSTRLDGSGIARVERETLLPTLNALARDGRPYCGVLYAGLMVTRTRAKVLEFNVRFGDPETQVILPRLKCDLGALLLACAEGRLDSIGDEAFDWDPRAAVTVVLCSGGYPGAFTRGHPIEGIVDADAMDGVIVFHAGTARVAGRVVTTGGRVLNVTALGSDLADARQRAYEAVSRISFENMHFRTDIGVRALDGVSEAEV
ncbi:MAG: phosphoribosylamine--glycine ligase [Planctomycetes bacterium]|nr:phosphoribosylamine--glycine ligase [Planctomycetota bacterium]